LKPYTRSIIELFDGKRRYLIPLYQRQYAWKVEPDLRLLWQDIERAVDRIETDRTSVTPHFMGAIVISQIKTFGKQVQAFEIIDGQQRLTTFQLLLSALRDVATANHPRYAEELQKYLLNDGVMENPEVEQFKLWPSLVDRRVFVAIVDPNADLDAIARKPSDEEGLVRRAVEAHAYFKSQIEAHARSIDGFDEHRFEILFEALQEGLAIVSIELERGDDPQTIFESLNSRGVPLSPGDLMRNFIFQRAKGMGQAEGSLVVDKLYEKHWLPLDGGFWSQIDSRGRQSRPRLDWMLTDHLSMHVGDLVSVESLFRSYQRWIFNDRPFASVSEELDSISATASVERRLFEQTKDDPLGEFGRFANAFDVSTAMPLVVYLATDARVTEADLSRALTVLQSYILRRDICGLTTKNYNRLFVGLIDRLRASEDNRVDVLVAELSSRQSDIDRWPDDAEWRQKWLERDQYKGPRQPRLRLIFEAIEQAKRSALNEDIEIKSNLTVEHIMPQSWRGSWAIAELDHLDADDPRRLAREREREAAINKMGNLTLLTGSLNASVSNGTYSVKMPAVRSHSSLALNRELNAYDHWNEETIAERGLALFRVACRLWQAPDREELRLSSTAPSDAASPRTGLPPDGTACRFTYFGRAYAGRIENGSLRVDGLEGTFNSFSGASSAVTNTARNGWNDWQVFEGGAWMSADDWRKLVEGSRDRYGPLDGIVTVLA
jgi:hypothetical protein